MVPRWEKESVGEDNFAEVILPEKFVSGRKHTDQLKLSFLNLSKTHLKLLYAMKEQFNTT